MDSLKKNKKNSSLGNINGKYVVKSGVKTDEKISSSNSNGILVEN